MVLQHTEMHYQICGTTGIDCDPGMAGYTDAQGDKAHSLDNNPNH